MKSGWPKSINRVEKTVTANEGESKMSQLREKLKKIGVVGAGQMGNGITQVSALKGWSVVMMDVQSEALDNGLATIAKSCDRLIKKGSLNEEDKAQCLERIQPTTEIKDLSSCDLVIEAATENGDLKAKIFQQLDRVCQTEALLCSNTSSLSITQIAATTSRPQQVAGIHFMNPVPLMKLVEGIRGLQTSEETFSLIKAFAEDLGKTWVESSDRPGFIVNRILMPMINEAFYAIYEGVAAPEAIDAAMTLGTNQPMGPLTLADFIGLDTCLAIMKVLHTDLGDSKYRPCPLLAKYVEAGWLGRKSGCGVYNYKEA